MYVLSFPFFTQCPTTHGPPVTMKLLVICWTSTILIISIYLTILASRQGILASWLASNIHELDMPVLPCGWAVPYVSPLISFLMSLNQMLTNLSTFLIFSGCSNYVHLTVWIYLLLITYSIILLLTVDCKKCFDSWEMFGCCNLVKHLFITGVY